LFDHVYAQALLSRDSRESIDGEPGIASLCVKCRGLVVDSNNFFFFNTADEPSIRKRSRTSPVEDGDRPTKNFAYCDPKSPHFSSVSCTHLRHTTTHPRDITTEILEYWLPDTTVLPAINELSQFLDAPLHEHAKIPVEQFQFDSLISNSLDVNRIGKEDLEKLFRVDDQENAEALYRRVGLALDDSPPYFDGTVHSFISFWDSNIRKIIQALVPGGVSIRGGSNQITASQPSYGFLYHDVCAFRGEEKVSNNLDDPKTELNGKMAWTYDPAPYVLGEVFSITSLLP
jgi:hypothetical protein